MMNAEQFKAWFEGFSEGKEVPTAEQWARVKEMVKRLADTPVWVTQGIFPSVPSAPQNPWDPISPAWTSTAISGQSEQ